MRTPASSNVRGHLGRLAPAVLLASLLVAACGGGAPAPSPTPAAGVDSAEKAAAAVAARTPLFDGITALNPDVIGASAWWEAEADGKATPPVAWSVRFTIGWGDCEAGCINRHTWTYTVQSTGEVAFVEETGSPLEEDVIAARNVAATTTGIGGRVTAGPTCPVERPGDPACAPRPVSGAVLVVTDGSGKEVAKVTTDGSGLFRIPLAAGEYTITPQAVEGFIGGAQPVTVTVVDKAQAWAPVDYDTGIR